tara:strand:+ start:30 stop:533 length:504 start_codon:yes stop_codon:yes gene_type:complete
MAITRIGGANAISGTIPAANVATLTSSNLPTGSVLQVVSSQYSTETSSTSTTIIDTGLAASITPSSTSSKILVTASMSVAKGNDNTYGDWYIFRGDTELIRQHRNITFNNRVGHNYVGASFNYLDSPSTTSSQEYKIRFRRSGGGSAAVESQTDDSVSVMTLIEIKG